MMERNTIPDPQQPETECALYRHFNADGDLLYVGISISAVRRLGEHQSSVWARQISRVTVEWLPSRVEAESRERQAIREEKPKFNIAGTVIACAGNQAFSNGGTAMTPTEIKEARKSLGLDQSQAALMLGYGANARISEIEAGTRNPSESVLRLLAAYVAGYRPPDWPAH